jgi:superfamily II DNA or RNA helicase
MKESEEVSSRAIGSSEGSNEKVTSRNLRNFSPLPEYNTEDNNVVKEFYAPCLSNSTHYDRAVGYFRASIYRLLGEEILDFVIAGGAVRIVCSPDMPEQDESAAREGYALRGKRDRSEIDVELTSVIRAMSGSPQETDCLSMLRLLIEMGSLDLFVAMRPGGIYHRKIGRFSDAGGNMIVFSGSGNETPNAVGTLEDWSNDEDFDVFRSWGDPYEAGKARKKSEYLDALFSGKTKHTRIRPLNETELGVLQKCRLHSSLEECRQGARERSRIAAKPLAPLVTGPYYYQEQAIEAWRRSNRTGMLAMATGTGKTITALYAIGDLVDAGNPVLILVPSQILLNQWHDKVREIFPGVPVLLAGGGHDWRSIPSKRMFVADMDLPRITISTMQTAATADFMDFFGQARELVMVVDEAHRLGSEVHRRVLELKPSSLLGLSATPERPFDKAGSLALKRSFGDAPVYSLPLDGRVKLNANDSKEIPILGHFLSRYYYDFVTVNLTAAEENQWKQITSEIKRIIARNPELVEEGLLSGENNRLKMLYIQRARIVKTAEAKVTTAARVVMDRYSDDGRWIVYCDNEVQLDAVVARIKASCPNVTVLKYHSGLEDGLRRRVLEHFEQNPGIIVSIRCLDEGVDIPSADGALILASSTNPREYIQRRGRLLRKAKGKSHALIIDVLVLPSSSEEENEIPMSIIRSEMARAFKFASSSENKEITHSLWNICRAYGVNLMSDPEISIQEEEMEGQHGS